VNEENQKNGSKGSKKEKNALKKKPVSNPPVKENKNQFSHKWLLTTLKGHTATILDMDLSPSGKHVATCSEGKYKHSSTLLVVHNMACKN
jgi:transducin beta-like protein 2